mgnify:CR=1 FL=1
MQFTITHWGCTPSGDSIYLFRLTNATGASIELTNLGATWVSANMPNRYDVFENILLGYDHAEGYLKDTYYMGALSAGLPTAFIRHPFLSKALPICWRKTTERTPITADYPAFTRRYGNGNGQIPASVSFSTLRTWKEDIREMYRRKWNINSRKPTN